jgi:signal transduction histidine kinase
VSRRLGIRPTVRLRLTLIYSGLFVAAAAALLSLNYVLVRHRERQGGTARAVICGAGFQGTPPVAGRSTPTPCPPPVVKAAAAGDSLIQAGTAGTMYFRNVPPPAGPGALNQLTRVVTSSQQHTLHTLEVESGLALGLMAIASLGLGWLVAGRALRPVHRITETARRLSQETLDDRINLDGPNDELKELADTFDAMLGRLDRAFSSQRRFVANASHELRTPLATERVLIDEGLANRHASCDDLRAVLEQLRVNSEDSERLVNALLVLARSERGVDRWVATDMAELTAEVVERTRAEAVTAGVTIRSALAPAPTVGDPALLERLIGNLVENAVRHNLPSGGWVDVTTTAPTGRVVLRVANSGHVVDPDIVPALFGPFRREGPDRTSAERGFGLGLSIVQAVVDAHRGCLEATALKGGGLEIVVSLAASVAVVPGDGPGAPMEPTAGRAGVPTA